MSEIKVNSIKNTNSNDGGVAIDSSGHVQVDGLQIPTAGALSNRNLVQNGAMTVSQRSTSESSLTSGNNYILDRWRTYIQNIGTYTISQASDAPVGFKYSYKIQCTTADASPAAGDDMSFYCPYEGQDLQQLKKGTSAAESLTLSFWIKSNKTATGQVNIRDQDNNRLISGTYTVSASGTWEYKTITFPGDTTGALDNDNAASISIQWYLDSGSNFSSGSMNSTWGADSTDKRNVNNFGLASSTDNYWQITGIQLEIGEKATVFEHRSFNDELARCQRYYCHYGHPFETVTVGQRVGAGFVTAPTQAHMILPTGAGKMRANPTPDHNDVEINDASTNKTISSFGTVTAYNGHVHMTCNTPSGLNEGRACNIRFSTTSGNFFLNAEL